MKQLLEQVYLALLKHPDNSWRVENQEIYVNVREALASLLGETSQSVQNHYEQLAAKQMGGTIRARVRQVNNAFHQFSKFYHSLSDTRDFVTNTLTSFGFCQDGTEGLASRIEGEVGEVRTWPVGNGVFLCVTWYKMPSGNYEFVGYVS